jgi:hypothetical protein
MMIERELTPGLHEIQVWRHGKRDELLKEKVSLLRDMEGQEALQPCPSSMFDPTTFPEGVQALLPQPATVTDVDGGLNVQFGDRTQARLVRMTIFGFQGVAPGIMKVGLSGRDGNVYLPVKQDFMALRDNDQLEVLPGDTITAFYEDAVTATPTAYEAFGSPGGGV